MYICYRYILSPTRPCHFPQEIGRILNILPARKVKFATKYELNLASKSFKIYINASFLMQAVLDNGHSYNSFLMRDQYMVLRILLCRFR